jgi:hypothetical protein
VPSGRFLRWGADLAGEVTGQALIPGVNLGFDPVAVQQVFEALGAQRGNVMHPAGPERTQPQQPALAAADWIVFCFFLPDTNARRPGRFAAGRRTCTFGAQPVPPTAPGPQPRLLLRQPRLRELLDQLAELVAADPGADTMRQGRTGPS